MFGAAGRVALAAGALDAVLTVTQGTAAPSGFDYYGYNDGTNGSVGFDIGSISPSTLGGNNIVHAYYYDFTTGSFYFGLDGGDHTSDPDQFFTSLTPEGGSELLVSARSGLQYNASRDYTFWWWDGTGVPAAWDGAGDVDIIVDRW